MNIIQSAYNGRTAWNPNHAGLQKAGNHDEFIVVKLAVNAVHKRHRAYFTHKFHIEIHKKILINAVFLYILTFLPALVNNLSLSVEIICRNAGKGL